LRSRRCTGEVVARFDGGEVTTDAGGWLLREVDGQLRLIDRLAACFTDHRQRARVEHSVRDVIAQADHWVGAGL
jgi:hypothetical protein